MSFRSSGAPIAEDRQRHRATIPATWRIADRTGDGTFESAIWDYPLNQGLGILVTFGTDTSLKAAPGWDNATGLGVTSPADLVSYVMTMAASTKH